MKTNLRFNNITWVKWVWALIALVMVFTVVDPVGADRGNGQVYTTGERQRFVAPDGQVFLLEEFTITSVSPTLSSRASLAAASGCKSITHGINMYNAIGAKVWSYAWKIDWCYNGSKITSLNPRRIVNIYSPGYSFKGDTRTTQGGVNQGHYYHFTQGDICYIDYGPNCAWHTYPTVEQDVNGVGGFYGYAWY
ncbi:MAG: hypothetical protein FJZ96_04735 [Chloroflexi bacterium]|nr:hypothetical protein [Chloroflexota bacterium]